MASCAAQAIIRTEVTTMLSENTAFKLRKMKLGTMADEYTRQMVDPRTAGLSFDERFGMIVDLEYNRRDNNRMARLVKNASFAERGASMEDVDYSAERKLDVDTINTLASCAFFESKLNAYILGATGAGKTFLACALGNQACRSHYAVKYVSLQDMLAELALAREEGNFNQAFAAYKKVRLLIIDDWLMFDVGDAEALVLYQLIEARKYVGPIIICSQIGPDGWHGRIENPVAADSICDRLVHSSYKLVVEGEMRKKTSARIFAEA
jgi:DNA replication protein DnaC